MGSRLNRESQHQTPVNALGEDSTSEGPSVGRGCRSIPKDSLSATQLKFVPQGQGNPGLGTQLRNDPRKIGFPDVYSADREGTQMFNY